MYSNDRTLLTNPFDTTASWCHRDFLSSWIRYLSGSKKRHIRRRKSKRHILFVLPAFFCCFLPYPGGWTTGISGSPCTRRWSRYRGPISICCATTGRPDDESCGLSLRVQQGPFPRDRAVLQPPVVSLLFSSNFITRRSAKDLLSFSARR